MRVVGLISGGKDSIYNLIECVKYGHEIVALANLYPESIDVQELDSFMFQTVGHNVIELIAQAMELPLFRMPTKGIAKCSRVVYDSESADDEVEDMFRLISLVQQEIPDVQAVASGAVLSNYQRLRVEHVCCRLGLHSLAYLWQRNQSELLQEMISSNQIDAILVKTAAMGLNPRTCLGKHLYQLQDLLEDLGMKFGINVCGEGGEYESLVLDCCLFESKRIAVLKCEIEGNEVDKPISQSGNLRIVEAVLIPKDPELYRYLKPVILSQDSLPSQDSVLEKSISSKSASCSSDRTLFCSVALEGLDSIDEAFSAFSDFGLSPSDALFLSLRIPCMKEFGVVNLRYQKGFSFNPPSRACVEGYKRSISVHALFSSGISTIKKECLHVQSVSRWAPACIGPYSQCVQFQGLLLLSGVIGLDPPTMSFTKTSSMDPSEQTRNCRTHIHSICDVFGSNDNNLLSIVAYRKSGVKFQSMVDLVCPCIGVEVPVLPRDALVELVPMAVQQSSEGITITKLEPRFSNDTLSCWSVCSRNFQVLFLVLPAVIEDADLKNMMNSLLNVIQKCSSNEEKQLVMLNAFCKFEFDNALHDLMLCNNLVCGIISSPEVIFQHKLKIINASVVFKLVMCESCFF
jgi:diphthine-ammonia ligase